MKKVGDWERHCIKSRSVEPVSEIFETLSNVNMNSLLESDIPWSSFGGRNPESLKVDELRFWLRCLGDTLLMFKNQSSVSQKLRNSCAID